MIYYYFISVLHPIYYTSIKIFKIQLLKPRSYIYKNPKTKHPLRSKMNENLFASFITPTIIGLPIVILIIIFLSMFFQTSNQQINNRLISFQQWLVQLTSKQIINIHNHKGQTWALILISFTGSINLLGLLPHPFTPTTQLSINLDIRAGTAVMSFCNKTKASLAHFLPQGTPISLIPILVSIKTISLFIQ